MLKQAEYLIILSSTFVPHTLTLFCPEIILKTMSNTKMVFSYGSVSFLFHPRHRVCNVQGHLSGLLWGKQAQSNLSHYLQAARPVPPTSTLFISRAARLSIWNGMAVCVSEAAQRNLKLTQLADGVLLKAIDLMCFSVTYCMIACVRVLCW